MIPQMGHRPSTYLLKLGLVGILYLATPRGLIYYTKTVIFEQKYFYNPRESASIIKLAVDYSASSNSRLYSGLR